MFLERYDSITLHIENMQPLNSIVLNKLFMYVAI